MGTSVKRGSREGYIGQPLCDMRREKGDVGSVRQETREKMSVAEVGGRQIGRTVLMQPRSQALPSFLSLAIQKSRYLSHLSMT